MAHTMKSCRLHIYTKAFHLQTLYIVSFNIIVNLKLIQMKSSETGTRAKLVHLNLPMNSPLYFLHYLPPSQEPCLREGNLSACFDIRHGG